MRTPETSGSTVPTVRPKEWNIGSDVEHEVLAAEIDDAPCACAALVRMLRWERTTPFGTPSDPDVNRITAQSSGFRATSGFL